MTGCPKCGFAAGAGAECPRCGIVYARWRGDESFGAADAAGTTVTFGAADAAGAATFGAADAVAQRKLPRTPTAPWSAPATEADAPAPAIDQQGWIAFGAGLAAALVVLALPLPRFVFSYFTTLVHEMGHAAAGWLFGYPSIPAFDFTYGGGVTLHQDRVLLLALAVFAAGVWAAHAARQHLVLRNVLIVLLGSWTVLSLTSGHDAVIVAMGHGGELIFATLFLHRALSGRGCVTPLERPLYGLIGWFIVLSDVGFAWQLLTSAHHRALYQEAKGGGHWMDFSRLSEEFLHVPLEAIAAVFLVLCRAAAASERAGPATAPAPPTLSPGWFPGGSRSE